MLPHHTTGLYVPVLHKLIISINPMPVLQGDQTKCKLNKYAREDENILQGIQLEI